MKKYLFPVLAISALVILTICLFTCKDKVKELKQDTSAVAVDHDSTQYYKDLYGTEHAKRQETEANISTLKVLHDSAIADITKRLRIKDKQLKSFYSVGVDFSNLMEGVVTVNNKAGKKDTSANFNDGALKANLKWGKKPVLNYTFHDNIVLVQYWKKNWLLGRKYNYVDAYSLAPHSDTKGLVAASVTNKEPSRWGIGLFAGYGISSTGLSPMVGVGISYSLIKFK